MVACQSFAGEDEVSGDVLKVRVLYLHHLSNSTTGMLTKRRYDGLRNINLGGSSVRTPHRVPIPQRASMPNIPSSLEDDIPEFEDVPVPNERPRNCRPTPAQERGSSVRTPHRVPIPQRASMPNISSSLEDDIPEFVDVPVPNEPGTTEGSSTSQPKTKSKWIVDVIDEEGNRSQRSLKVNDLIPNKIGFKVVTEWNERIQPVGNSAGLLGGFLGFLASNFDTFPILYTNWHEVPEDYKNVVYNNDVKEKFVVNDGGHKTWVFSSLGKKWRDNRCKLFKTNYNWELTPEQNVRNPPEDISEDHWRLYLNYRLDPETMAKADQNAVNRSKQQVPHTLGTKSYARLRHELELKDGRPYSRADMYGIAHKKSNGDFVNDQARQNHEKLKQAVLESSSEHEAFVEVFGKEHPGHCRGMGLRVTPTQLLGHNSRSTTESYSSDANEKISQMQNEIDALKAQVAEVDTLKAQAAEVNALKEQVSELPLLKEQLAFVMRLLQQNQPVNLESQDGLRRSSGSSHIGHNEATPSRRMSG